MAEEKRNNTGWIILAGGIVVAALAASVSIGAQAAKGLREGVGDLFDGFKTPSINVQMPSINLPDTSGQAAMLGYLLGTGYGTGYKIAENLGEKTGETARNVWDTYRPGIIWPKPDYTATAGTLAALMPELGIATGRNMTDQKKSTSQGGSGIFVENGENDYYVKDNSLYSKESGMPAPQPAPILPEQPQGYYGKDGDARAVSDSKAEALRKIAEYEKLYGVDLPGN